MGLPNIGPMELIIILVVALLILGPGKHATRATGRRARHVRGLAPAA